MEPGDIGKVTEPRSLGFLQNEKFGFQQHFAYHHMHTDHLGIPNAGSGSGALGRDLGLCMSRVMLAPGPLFEQQGTR